MDGAIEPELKPLRYPRRCRYHLPSLVGRACITVRPGLGLWRTGPQSRSAFRAGRNLQVSPVGLLRGERPNFPSACTGLRRGAPHSLALTPHSSAAKSGWVPPSLRIWKLRPRGGRCHSQASDQAWLQSSRSSGPSHHLRLVLQTRKRRLREGKYQPKVLQCVNPRERARTQGKQRGTVSPDPGARALTADSMNGG